MKLVKVTTKGRVTIPAKLRKKYKLNHGAFVKFDADEDGIKLIPLAASEEIKANAGFLETRGKLLKVLMKEKKRERKL